MIKFKNWKTAVCLLAVLIFWGAYGIAAFYGIPVNDDFSNANSMSALANVDYLMRVITKSAETYMNWQGTYTGTFMTYVLNTFANFGIIGIRVEYLLCVLLFWGIMVILLYQFTGFFADKHKVEVTIFLFLLYMVYGLSFLDVGETFYWHTGICMYTIPLTLAIASITLYCSAIKRNKMWKIILASVLAFLAAGGSLQISAFICVSTFGICGLRILLDKKLDKTCSVFIFAFLGSIVNASAPGNFVRHSQIDKEYHIFGAILDSAKSVYILIAEDLQRALLIDLVVFLFLFGIYTLSECDFRFPFPGLITAYLVIGMIVIDFPVKLGYGSGEFPVRCVFIEKVTIALFIMLIVLYWSGWLGKKWEFCFKKEHIVCIVISLLIANVSVVQSEMINNIVPIKIYRQWINGNLSDYSNTNLNLLDEIADSPEKDVITEKDEIDGMGIYMQLDLREDSEHWVNKAVAQYYNKDTVQIIRKEAE